MNDTSLKIINAGFSFVKGNTLFKNVNFELKNGEIITILGPNGAGKSTLLSCISGFRKLDEGKVELNGADLKKISGRQLAKSIGMVPQNQVRTYDFSVREYIAMGRAPYLGFGKSPSKDDYKLVDEIMDQMKIRYLSDQLYTKISGGESQQVLIARVLVQQPQIIMLDEPVNHLDYGNQIKILKLLRQLAEKGYGIILTSHMPDHALLLDSTIGILNRDGHMQMGKASALLSEENLLNLYGEKICRTYVEKVKREACVPYPL